jgi:hypothetical protein
MASNDILVEELERFGRNRLWHNSGTVPRVAWGTDKNHGNSQSGQPMSRSRFKPGFSCIQIRRSVVTAAGSSVKVLREVAMKSTDVSVKHIASI